MTLKNYPNVTLILCGSVSTWIEKNIVNSTAFFGRISLQLDLDELSLSSSHKFLKSLGITYSDYDMLKILSVTGGVPWYLEQLNPGETADENIRRLCFEQSGILVNEFDRIFNDLFERRSNQYKAIIHTLTKGMRSLSQLRTEVGYAHSGSFGDQLQALCVSGFISRHYNWSLKTGKIGKQSLYRLSDNYIRFYVKYIEPNLPKINKGSFQEMSLTALPGWNSMMGFQVENLLLKNRHLLLQALDIQPHDIVADNPFVQKQTVRHRGCQIDYLIQTHSNNLYVCEFKFRKKELNSEIIEEVKDKVSRFSVPRGFGVSPVLIHVGGVSDTVHDEKYFYRIIDITDFWENY